MIYGTKRSCSSQDRRATKQPNNWRWATNTAGRDKYRPAEYPKRTRTRECNYWRSSITQNYLSTKSSRTSNLGSASKLNTRTIPNRVRNRLHLYDKPISGNDNAYTRCFGDEYRYRLLGKSARCSTRYLQRLCISK